jgi:hypothetical protein
MAETAASSSATTRLNAFLAALAELDESQKVALLRSYLEYGLEVVQANEEEYYRFLSECAMLAADNMQDIRIENIELRLNAMENPPAKAWGEVLTDVALNLALQVGILIGWEVVAGSIIAVMGQKVLASATRAASAEVSAARSQSSTIRETLARLQTEKENLLILGGRYSFDVKPTRGGWKIQPSPAGRFESFQVPSLNPRTIRERYDAVVAETAIAQSATTVNSVRVSKALKTYEAAIADGEVAKSQVEKKWGKIWRENVGNEKGGVLISTTKEVIETLDAVLAGIAADSTETPPSNPGGQPLGSEPFLSSEITGRYLTWASEERLRVAESYASMRLMLRATSDSDLLEGDDFIKFVALLGTEMLQRWHELRQSPHYARAAIVKGFEAAFWREYLLANAVLVEPRRENYISKAALARGAIVGGYLIQSDGSEVAYQTGALKPPSTGILKPADTPPPQPFEHAVDFYPGAARLPDLLAGTLFKRFAQPYFADGKNAQNLSPFPYDATKYTNVAIPPVDNFWGYPEPEALRRIDEMRYMVIKFFTFFTDIKNVEPDPALPATVGIASFMNDVAGAEAAKNRDAWLAGQAQGEEIGGQESAAENQRATQSAEEQFKSLAQITEAATGGALALQLAQLQFADMLTDLNQDIQAYQLLKFGALEVDNTVDKRTHGELATEIGIEKGVLLDKYDELLTQAGDDKEARAALVGLYQTAVDAIKQWEAGDDWVWYGPTYVEEEPVQ